MKGHDLSIFFDLKDAPARGYEAQAWKVFMRHSDPQMLKDSQFFHGSVSGLVPGADHLYCIAIRTKNPETIQYLKNIFAACDDRRLAPPHDRLRESGIVQKYQLKFRARMDSDGCFETQEWSRSDHELCMATGWPYVPHIYPAHISPELMDELEAMATPGRKKPDPARDSRPGMKAVPVGRSSSASAGSWLKIIIRTFVAILVVAALVVGWLARDKIFTYISECKEALSMKLELGSDAYAKYKEGFALVGIAKVPHDLDVAILNEKLEGRAYYVIAGEKESSCDAIMNCTVWFSPQEKLSPSPQTTIQAFIKAEMRSAGGAFLWMSQSKGVRSAPGTEKANPNLRYKALSAAIENIDLFCLVDGKSVRSFQANNDHDGLRKHAQHLMAQCRNKPDDQCEDMAALEIRLWDRLAKQWIMSSYFHMKTGKKLSALIMEENPRSFRLRMRSGTTSIAKEQVEKMERFTREQYIADINEILRPIKKKLNHEWQYDLCDALVEETADKCIAYGPPVPNMRVVSISSDKDTGDHEATVRTAREKKTVKINDKLQGHTVIGIDEETNTVIVRMGKKGETLRIWPRGDSPQPPASRR